LRPEDAGHTPSTPIITEDERRAALRAGRTPVPTKFILLVVAAFVILGLGGVVLERLVGIPGQSISSNPAPATTPPTLPITPHSILGLKTIAGRTAPGFTLTDQRGSTWSLGAQRGRVVILAFYNQTCNDICPVLGSELHTSIALLGTNARRVEIAIVNTDPNHAGVVARPAALVEPRLEGRANVVFLTGTLPSLNAVWTHYGIQVRVGQPPAPVLHNDVLYFITARGDLHALATPFANESRQGVFALDRVSRRAFAAGIAEIASNLLP
jgi:cytochrome oxidase Cu insertion factor (SCO1/SenC/PrrC family)